MNDDRFSYNPDYLFQVFKQDGYIRKLFQKKVEDETSFRKLESLLEKGRKTTTLLETRLKTNADLRNEISTKNQVKTDLLKSLSKERNLLLEETRDKRFRLWICGVKISCCF